MLTPINKADNLAKLLKLNNNNLYLKREDLHHFASHKGRSIPLMIEKYILDGQHSFSISSSGNAALAAALTVVNYNIKNKLEQVNLTIYIGQHINLEKLENIKQISDSDNNITIKQVENPKQQAFLDQKNHKSQNIRQSTDNLALIGYEKLAEELSEIENLSAIFIPTSSGTTAEGLWLAFKKLNLNPQIHIIQTNTCHPFISNNTTDTKEKSIASAIVDKVGHRKKQIEQMLKETNNIGWIATNEEISEAIKQVKISESINISPNSALSVVGLKKAIKNNIKFSGPVVCLITGR